MPRSGTRPRVAVVMLLALSLWGCGESGQAGRVACGADLCGAHAACVGVGEAEACGCVAGFAGDGFSCVDVDECATGIAGCATQASCVNAEGGYECECAEGWTGDGFHCEDVDECGLEQSPCADVARCDNLAGGVLCTCPVGYEGDGSQCEDVDECAEGVAACGPNAACKNVPGSYDCECVDGYEAVGDACVDIDECETGAAGCDTNASCTNTDGGFTCTCKPGFEGDGGSCADVDECGVANGGCDPNAVCANEVGSFLCTCSPGFEGDGFVCADVDECIAANGGCDVNAVCENTVGSFNCACATGFSGDGWSCADVDECASNNGGCHASATCTNTIGGFACACIPGFVGDGLQCVDVDECASNNGGCDQNASCTNSMGSFSCDCASGYSGDGFVCVDVDECATMNGGCDPKATCTNTPGSRICTCNPGYQGDGLTCACASPPPIASAGSDQVLVAAEPLPLDGSGSTGNGLTYTWTAIGEAPPPASPGSAVTFAPGQGCGALTYQLTVMDACGQQAADTVTFTVPANGPHVSGTTCTNAQQCGTPALPWCTIGGALANSASSPIKVAKGVYPGGLVMVDGLDVEGGYAVGFGSRDPDPHTNDTVVTSQGTVLTFGAGVTATVDGIEFRSAANFGQGTPTFVSISLWAQATLWNVIVGASSPSTTKTGSLYGILTEGDLILDGGSEVTLQPSTQANCVLEVKPGGSAYVGSAALTAASGQWVRGVFQDQTQPLVVDGATITTGTGTTTRGIEALGNVPSVDIANTDIVVGEATKSAVALEAIGVGSVTVTGSYLQGGVTPSSTNDPTTFAAGVRADGVGALQISASEILGRPGTSLDSDTAGVYLANTIGAPVVGAAISNVVVTGAQSGRVSGLMSDGVPFTLTGSDVLGAFDSDGPSNSLVYGIRIMGAFSPGDQIVIDGNASIGGASYSTGFSSLGTMFGIRVEAPGVQTIVANNAAVRGCVGTCDWATAYAISAIDSPLSIAGNTLVEGGRAGELTVGIHGDCANASPVVVHVTGNDLIAGHSGAEKITDDAYGVLFFDCPMVVENNTIIEGPSRFDGRALELRWGGEYYRALEVRDNTITTSLVEFGTLTMERNMLGGCVDGYCAVRLGLFLRGSLGSIVRNNYSLTGCRVETQGSSSLEFVHNLCFGVGTPLVVTGSAPQNPFVFMNNILHPTAPGATVSVSSIHVLAFNDLLQPPPDIWGEQCYLKSGNDCIETLQDLEAFSPNFHDNFTVAPAYVAASPTNAPEGFHLSPCNLAGTGTTSTAIDDFDGEPRANPPTVGPDECQ